LEKQVVHFSDLGKIDYKTAWDYQEEILSKNVAFKTEARLKGVDANPFLIPTTHHLLFCEHPPVYTLGKSGNIANVLLSNEEMNNQGIEFFRTNRGHSLTMLDFSCIAPKNSV
jgi:lipoyl(octanoyl) transferase